MLKRVVRMRLSVLHPKDAKLLTKLLTIRVQRKLHSFNNNVFAVRTLEEDDNTEVFIVLLERIQSRELLELDKF